MRRIIYVALLAMAVSVPAFAVEADQGARMDEAKKEMRAMEDRHMQERRALQDECQDKMRAMRERHQKEREDLKSKYGMDKGGREGMGGGDGNRNAPR